MSAIVLAGALAAGVSFHPNAPGQSPFFSIAAVSFLILVAGFYRLSLDGAKSTIFLLSAVTGIGVLGWLGASAYRYFQNGTIYDGIVAYVPTILFFVVLVSLPGFAMKWTIRRLGYDDLSDVFSTPVGQLFFGIGVLVCSSSIPGLVLLQVGSILNQVAGFALFLGLLLTTLGLYHTQTAPLRAVLVPLTGVAVTSVLGIAGATPIFNLGSTVQPVAIAPLPVYVSGSLALLLAVGWLVYALKRLPDVWRSLRAMSAAETVAQLSQQTSSFVPSTANADSAPQTEETYSLWAELKTDLAAGLTATVIISRAVLFRLFSFTLLFLCLILVMVPFSALIETIPILVLPVAALIGTLFLGTVGLFFWQIFGGMLSLWRDLWVRTTPPNPQPLRGQFHDAMPIGLWEELPKSIEDYDTEPHFNLKLVRSVIHGIALGTCILGVGVGLTLVYLKNRTTWDIYEMHLFFDGLEVVVGKVAIWYGPIVEFLQTVGIELMPAKLLAMYIVFLTLPGALIMKNALYKIEEFVYRVFSRLGTQGRILLGSLLSSGTLLILFSVPHKVRY